MFLLLLIYAFIPNLYISRILSGCATQRVMLFANFRSVFIFPMYSDNSPSFPKIIGKWVVTSLSCFPERLIWHKSISNDVTKVCNKNYVNNSSYFRDFRKPASSTLTRSHVVWSCSTILCGMKKLAVFWWYFRFFPAMWEVLTFDLTSSFHSKIWTLLHSIDILAFSNE